MTVIEGLHMVDEGGGVVASKPVGPFGFEALIAGRPQRPRHRDRDGDGDHRDEDQWQSPPSTATRRRRQGAE